MPPNPLLAAKRSYELDAGFFYIGSGAGNAVECTLSPANIAFHVCDVDYVMFPPLDLSGSCGSGKQLRIMVSGRAIYAWTSKLAAS